MKRVLMLLPLAAAITMIQACGQSQATATDATKAKDEAKVAVETAKVSQGPWVRRLDTTAVLEAEHAATLVAENGGEIISLLVEEGDVVSKGQILARIDGKREHLLLKQQESVARRLQHEAARQQMLLDRKMVSSDMADLASFNRDAQEALVDLAEVDLSRTLIRAPFSGTITHRHAKQGQTLKPNEPVFSIADFSDLRAEIAVPERELVDLAPGQPVAMLADAFANTVFSGEVERLGAVVDAKTGTAKAIIDVAEQGTQLRPGQFVRLSIEREHIDQAVLMPRAALLNGSKETAVFAIVDGKAKRTRVELGGEQDGQVQVLNGLQPGMDVVVMGQAQLIDGDAVDVINASARKDAIAAR